MLPSMKRNMENYKSNQNHDMNFREINERLRELIQYKDREIEKLKAELAQYESKPKVQCVIRILAPQNPT